MKSKILVIGLALLGFSACEEEVPTPKPFGYNRIDYGTHVYKKVQPEMSPFSLDIGVNSVIELTDTENPKSGWFNVVYPAQKAKVHFSYFPIERELEMYVEDARKLAMKHLVKADNYEEFYINDTTANVYGVVYDFSGRAASNMQFYLTDSTKHFVRGALYFEVIPNADSLAPAEKFIEEEIQQMVGSLQWVN